MVDSWVHLKKKIFMHLLFSFEKICKHLTVIRIGLVQEPWLLLLFARLGVIPRTEHILDKWSVAVLCPQPLN